MRFYELLKLLITEQGVVEMLISCLVSPDPAAVREGRAYNLKRTNMEDKHWVCRQMTAFLTMKSHIKWRRKILSCDRQRGGIEDYSSNIPLIRSASADLETASQFPTYKSVEMAMYRKRAQKFPRLPPTRQQLEIPPQWEMTKSGRRFVLYNNFRNGITRCLPSMFSLRTALIPALQGTFPGFYIKGCYFHFFQAVLRKVTDLGTRTSYIHEAATKKKVKMLLAMCRVQRKR
ncbi:hypothetical protein T4C_2106 [Trichinella pseudospiralis]|uniref:MULE transposase domain-containing protein n=1 Tax=Trichinella pseudospiralis TaxID=6337 RepID=A0A0V1JT84_TRIPS|nr:hypothetical protein T4C_2106 [Trichinella pseudospiralis]